MNTGVVRIQRGIQSNTTHPLDHMLYYTCSGHKVYTVLPMWQVHILLTHIDIQFISVYSIHITVYSIHITVYSIHITVYSIHISVQQCIAQYIAMHSTKYIPGKIVLNSIFLNIQRSTFVGLAWSFVFFIPTTTANGLGRIFYPRFYPLHLFSYLNS